MSIFHLDALLTHLQGTFPPSRLVTDDLGTRALGADASFYRLQPAAVVTVESETEVQALLSACRNYRAPVTFRAAGTSLSGQAVTDSILARLGDGWSRTEVHDDGQRVTLGAGVIGGRANAWLKPYGRKLGPDPASIGACMIGGIAANNASGMCCGTEQNSYRTLETIRLITADGTVLDTGDPQSILAFRGSHAALLDGLATLRREVLADPELADRIRRKFTIKNTTGYSLNALIDFEDPIDILTHLIIGSEGTLAFISEVTFRTVPDPRYKAATLAFYDSPRAAADVVIGLREAPVAAVELIDRAGIRSAEGKPGMPEFLIDLGPAATALLVEVQAESQAELIQKAYAARLAMDAFAAVRPFVFSRDQQTCASYWTMRKGLFPAVGGLREMGTTVIIEDVAFPVERLGHAVTDLQALFKRWQYEDAILFGHARDGNLHVVFSQDFRSAAEIERYAGFMDELCTLVVHRYDGSLKAEHGTGRNVAPFVELEWGATALALMHRIKALFDPEGLLNPGVILNNDPDAHLQNLKDLPAVHPIVDTCTECGFCESKCPSHLLTLSPRQRTVAFRGLAAQAPTNHAKFPYAALDTCATCGLCAEVCPMHIDTGAFVKKRRAHGTSAQSHRFADQMRQNFGLVRRAAGLGLRAADLARTLVGAGPTTALTRAASRLSGGRLPQWNAAMPGGYHFRPRPLPVDEPRATFVYLPSCLSRTMRPRDKDTLLPIPRILERIAARAGISLIYPEGLSQACCGQPFESKGFAAQGDAQGQAALRIAADAAASGTSIRVLSDTSPCTSRLQKLSLADVEVVDIVSFLHDYVLGHVPFTPVRAHLAVHPTCSIQKMGLTGKLEALARACARRITVPTGIECCGFAGDRGFSHPELNAHALRTLGRQIEGAEAGCSTSLTCEIGLTQHGGVPYRSIAYFVDEATGGVEPHRRGGTTAAFTPSATVGTRAGFGSRS